MKKQILILMFFVAAFLVGNMNAFGQLLQKTVVDPIPPLNCAATSEPLHPMPGVAYTYKMNGTTGEEQADQWQWYATKDSTFIDASGLRISSELTTASGALLAVGNTYGTGATVNGDSVSITWSPEILANTLYEGVASETNFPSPTFVVGYATGVNCADNIEVYEINPVPAFVVDIANIDEGGNSLTWEQDTAECVDIVRSAEYRSSDDSLIMDYGTDTLYFEIVAANFVTSWTPYLQIVQGLSGSQTADIGIATTYADAVAGTFLGSGEQTGLVAGDSTSFGGVELTANTAADVVTGVSVYARVVIHNNTWESTSSQTFTLAANGQDYSGQWDLEDDNCATPATADYDLDDDLANQHLRPRPTITHDTYDTGDPEPNTIIDKQRN